jgi:hypothetical protein
MKINNPSGLLPRFTFSRLFPKRWYVCVKLHGVTPYEMLIVPFPLSITSWISSRGAGPRAKSEDEEGYKYKYRNDRTRDIIATAGMSTGASRAK